MNNNYTGLVIKNSYRELLYKIITAIFIRGLLLVIPVFWSNTINNLSDGNFSNTYSLVVIIIILSIFYYIWQYLNQVTWFRFYDKLYVGYTSLITKNNRDIFYLFLFFESEYIYIYYYVSYIYYYDYFTYYIW